jgi:tetratricopeptide (TPR) repeat protein
MVDDLMIKRLSLCFIALMVLSAGQFARAETSMNTAEQYYKAGMDAMKSGDFSKAGESFLAAYGKEASPPLLWNAARAYHQGGDLKRARSLYEKFLAVEKQTSPRWEKAMAFSKALTSALERQAYREEREAMEREITDKVTRKILSKLSPRDKKPVINSVVKEQNEPTDLTTAGWVTTGIGGLFTAGALTLTLLALDSESQAQNPEIDANGIVVSHTQVEAANQQKRADDLGIAAWITGVTGGAALVTGLVLLTMTKDSGLALGPTLDRPGLSLGGTF